MYSYFSWLIIEGFLVVCETVSCNINNIVIMYFLFSLSHKILANEAYCLLCLLECWFGRSSCVWREFHVRFGEAAQEEEAAATAGASTPRADDARRVQADAGGAEEEERLALNIPKMTDICVGGARLNSSEFCIWKILITLQFFTLAPLSVLYRKCTSLLQLLFVRCALLLAEFW